MIEQSRTMDHFHYRDGQLYCEETPVAALAGRFGTPLYVYSKATLLGQLKAVQAAFAEVDPLVCYSVKANSNLGVLKVLAAHGGGFDVVSGGELFRVRLRRGRAGQDGLRRGRQDRRGDQGGPGGGRPDVQRRERGRARRHRPRRLGRGPRRAHRPAGQPRRRPQDASLHLDRQEGVEVRDGHRPCAPAGRGRGRDARRLDDRHAHAHRVADHDHRALWRGGGQGRGDHRAIARDGPSNRVVQHGRGVRDQLPEARGTADRGVRAGDRPRRAGRPAAGWQWSRGG